MMRKRKKTLRPAKGQVIAEFAICMVIVMLMFYSLMKIFMWTGTDLVERRISHETRLFDTNVAQSYGDMRNSPIRQITPHFHYPTQMNAVFGNNN